MPSTATMPRLCRMALNSLGGLIALLMILRSCAASPGVNTPATRVARPTASLAPTATARPHPFSASTCAAGSLPIGSGYTQVHCAIASEGPYSLLRASYMGQGASGAVDDARLAADGWLTIDQAHGDSPNGAIGYALYFNQSAWLAVEYSYPETTMALEQGVPMSGPAPVPCGQILTAGSGQIQGVPTPSGMVTTRAGAYTFAPACLDDVKRFYTSALPLAGWTLMQSFQAPPGSVAGTPVTTAIAMVSRNGTTLTVWLAGGEGTPTTIVNRSRPAH